MEQNKIGIVRYGAYLPKYLLERKLIAEAWDFPSIPGGISVSNSDEDTITMAVEAGFDCIGELDPKSIDGIYFATTTPPYTEKQCASVIAVILDMRKDILTMDVTDSIRGTSIAIERAFETIKAGSAKRILVIGADKQSAMPESMYEYQYGDGAAAVLIGIEDCVVSIIGYASNSDNVTGPWKRAEDKYVRSFEGKHETDYGYTKNMIAAVKSAFEKMKIDPKDVKKCALYSPDPRKGADIAIKLGIPSKSVEGSPFLEFGNTGNAFALMILILSLKRSKANDIVLYGNAGDGADAILMKVEDKEKLIALRHLCRGVTGYKNSMISLPNYTSFLAKKKKLEKERFTRKASPVKAWRDEKFLLRFYGMKCKKCGVVQYPIWRACMECGAKDQSEDVKLKRTGKIFTFTLDHLVGGDYYDTPVPRCVIDLDGGGRVLLDMTDVENPEQVVKIDMPVELTPRWMHPGANYNNYYYKCRPIRVQKSQEEGEE
jgi:hydroxymethylglutaryl-CoA synthase